jgi:hypothetical protein
MDPSDPAVDPPVDPRAVVERLERHISDPDQSTVGEVAPLDAPAGDGAPSVPGTPEPPD